MLLKTCIGQFHGRVTQPQMAVMAKARAPPLRDPISPSSLCAQQTAPKTFHLSNRADSGCAGSGCLPPLTLRPFSQMAEGSAATKHLMTCDKCGQTAGPGWAPWRPLIGQGRLINNSIVTAGLLLSGRNEAPPLALAPGAGLCLWDRFQREGGGAEARLSTSCQT